MEQFIIWLISVAVLIPLGFFVGRYQESRHYESIKRREEAFAAIPCLSVKRMPVGGPVVREARLVSGSVVISVDYWKQLLAAIRNVFGGEVVSYSSLIDRSRREALLRMKAECPDADLYMNCRLETSAISQGNPKAPGTVEVMAYATAILYEKSV